MALEAGKEMDKRCVLNWLNEVYVTPSRAFNEYTEDELKMFAHDALALLKEQPEIVLCKDCIHYRYYGLTEDTVSECTIDHCENPDKEWFCADGEKEGR